VGDTLKDLLVLALALGLCILVAVLIGKLAPHLDLGHVPATTTTTE
jgi:hypothetical protein